MLKDYVVHVKEFIFQYVKEFIHGDFGRTVPCVADLMGLCPNDVDIIELDVEDIDLDWPPESEAYK